MRKLALSLALLAAGGSLAALVAATRAEAASSVPVPWCSDFRPGLNQNVR